MKIKTSELSDTALDWAVAKCEDEAVMFDGRCMVFVAGQFSNEGWFKPSEDWAQGGPIVDREDIEILPMKNPRYQQARTTENGSGPWQCGPTKLIAAMRCFVASRLGDEVDVPEEFI